MRREIVARRRPTRHRIRQTFIEAEFEYEGCGKSAEFLAGVVAEKLNIDPTDVLAMVIDLYEGGSCSISTSKSRV
jgi:hypothetical protein